MNACPGEACLQGYLLEAVPSPLHRSVELHMVSCARCRAAFERVVSTHRRVNQWLSPLWSPADAAQFDAGKALTKVLLRLDAPEDPFACLSGSRTNPSALAASMVVQGVLVATLLLAGSTGRVQLDAAHAAHVVVLPIARPVQREASSGGGGQRSPLPVRKGEMPKRAPRVYVPPLVAMNHPALVIAPQLTAPSETWIPTNSAPGDPLGSLLGGGGSGDLGGVGQRRGFGDGNEDGDGTGEKGRARIFNAGNGTTMPSVLSKVDPEYSEEARKAKYSGAVLLSIVVNAEGKADDIRVIRSVGMGLDEKAIDAVRRWRFKPGMNQGVAVKVRAQIEVNFRLL